MGLLDLIRRRKAAVISSNISSKEREYPREIREGRNAALKEELQRRGFSPRQTIGYSKEAGSYNERGFLITGASKEEAIGLGHRYGQGSVLYGNELFMTHGKKQPSVRLGKMVAGKEARKQSYYTIVTGKKSITFAFK